MHRNHPLAALILTLSTSLLLACSSVDSPNEPQGGDRTDAATIDTASEAAGPKDSTADDTSTQSAHPDAHAEGPPDTSTGPVESDTVDDVTEPQASDADTESTADDVTELQASDADTESTTEDVTETQVSDGGTEDAVDTGDDGVSDTAFEDTAVIDPPPCDLEVIAFTQDNPEQFEFYELCVDLSGVSEAELQAIDATLYCGVSGMFAGCKSGGELGCHGDLLYAAPGSKAISDVGWATLCGLSTLEGVRVIAGGYWL